MRHLAVVDPRPDVRPRPVHGIRVRADAGGELRHDQARENGRASSIFSTQRQVGVSLGVAIMASILGAHMSLSRAPLPSEVEQALDRCAMGVRRRGADGLDRGVCRVVHPRRGCRGDDGGPPTPDVEVAETIP